MRPDLANAPVTALVASQLALSEASVVEAENRYELGMRAPAYWAMWDLRASARFRVAAGDRNAYVRLEVFVDTARRVLGAFGDEVEVFKELGDAILVRSTGMRPLLEASVLLAGVSDLWSAPRGPRDYTLRTRCAVTHGVATRLHRGAANDYVGAALDRLARLASANEEEDVVSVLDASAYESDPDVIGEYGFLLREGPLLLDRSKLKAGEPPVRYHTLKIDAAAFADARSNFRAFR